LGSSRTGHLELDKTTDATKITTRTIAAPFEKLAIQQVLVYTKHNDV
jgi:hypothetical protein